MNYLNAQSWLHPDIEDVCQHILVGGLDLQYKGLQQHKRETKNFWERNFQFVPHEAADEQAQLDVCVDSMGLVAFNLLLPRRESGPDSGGLRMAVLFNLNRSVLQAGDYKNDPQQAPFDLRRLARGMYFLGAPLDKLAPFGVSHHDEMEWVRPRHEAWQPLWQLRPEGVD